jgi:hypothetical protein
MTTRRTVLISMLLATTGFRVLPAVCTENLVRRCLQVKFPVPVKKIPVPRNIFPVNLHRELCEKSLQHSSFLPGNRFGKPQNRKIPCKIPC